MSTPERIDLSKFPHGGMYDELRRSYDKIDRLTAEIDRLRANALEWVTVTDDPATLPEAGRPVLVLLISGDWIAAVCSIGDRIDGGLDACWDYGDGGSEDVDPGDRWAYIPEALKS